MQDAYQKRSSKRDAPLMACIQNTLEALAEATEKRKRDA